MAIFTVKNLTFKYPGSSRKVLENIDFEIQPGEFTVICGSSGSGKTTLLRNLKPLIAPHGEINGEILFSGIPVSELTQKEQTSKIGYVLQNPDSQLVTDKVWHELAFGLESLGESAETIRLRTAEMASFFNIQTWFNKDVNQLSGGQKQLLNLASVMAMQPEVLILDEPTAQLDPIAAGEFLDNIYKVNRELGTTVILSEHRLEDVTSMADKMLVLDDGKVIANGKPSAAGLQLKKREHPMFDAMPAPMRIAASLSIVDSMTGRDASDSTCVPLDVRGGRTWLTEITSHAEIKERKLTETDRQISGAPPAMELKDVWFRYDRSGDDVIKDLSFKAYPGELLCILGGNGTGKTTALNIAGRIRKPYRGKVKCSGKCTILPQDPQTVFVKDTVRDDLMEMLPDKDSGRMSSDFINSEYINSVAQITDIKQLLDMHPYDLSGGEQQRAALAKVLLTEPDILLLDEPTKGLDSLHKEKFAAIIKRLKKQGIAIVMVSHDIEFCSKYADRCAMFFDGKIITENTPVKFFSGNSFYTTAANRMSRHIFENAVTAEDVVKLVKANQVTGAAVEHPELVGTPDVVAIPNVVVNTNSVSNQNSVPNLSNTESVQILDSAEAAGEVVPDCSADSTESGSISTRGDRGKTKLTDCSADSTDSKIKSRRRNLCMDIIFIGMAILTTFAGFYIFDNQKFLAVGVMIAIYSLVPFFVRFEQRKPKAREIVILAVMIALAVVSRAAFFMVPNFKPVLAVVIITGVALGREAGFLTGAMAALVSNFLFGQGPWTPWQMLAMAMGGYLAGLIFHRFAGTINKWVLALFGMVAAFFLYGGIVDLWTILAMTQEPDLGMAVMVYTAAMPFNFMHAAATGIFILLIAKPIIKKIERVKIKYGM